MPFDPWDSLGDPAAWPATAVLAALLHDLCVRAENAKDHDGQYRLYQVARLLKGEIA